jgi:amino acid adenylation domain-containing protein
MVLALPRRETPLTGAQQLLWLGQHLRPDAPLYNMALAFEIRGNVQPQHFDAAFRTLLIRSDALRTTIVMHADEPVACDGAVAAHPVEHVDLSMLAAGDVVLHDWMRDRAARPFDLGARLYDCALFRMGEDRWVWFLNQHHLITDGWSTALAFRNISEFYERSVAGTLGDAPALPQFADYVLYERAFRESPIFMRVRNHWADKRIHALEPVRMYGRQAAATNTRTERVTRDLGAVRSAAIRQFAAHHPGGMFAGHVPLFNIFATALFAWLHRISGHQRLAIGTPSHNRPTQTFKNTLGVFIEVFPFVIEMPADATFESLLSAVRRETATFLRHAQPGTSSAAVNRSCNVLLNYIHAAFPPFAGMPMRSEWIHPGHGDAAHHLRLQVHDLDATGTFLLHFDFHCDIFTTAEREAAADQFLNALDAFLIAPGTPIANTALLTPNAARAWIDAVNGAAEARTDRTVVDLFDAMAREAPDAVAISDGSGTIRYHELRGRALSLAARLRLLDVGRDSIVGLHTSNGADAILGILAVLYCGAAYVPLSPADPAHRLQAMINDAAVRIILTDADDAGGVARDLAQGPLHVLSIPRDGDVLPAVADPGSFDMPRGSDIAYILYTSGSTGRPKGVIIDHGALANYVEWARDTYTAGVPADFPVFTSLAFDLTVTSVFVPLVTGGRIRVYRESDALPAVIRVFEEGLVDVVKLTPSHISLLRGQSFARGHIRTLIVGGEELRTDQAKAAARAVGGDVTIYNEYGPTEATVGCMIHCYDPESDTASTVPIGRPAAGARILLLDDASNVVPAGVVGQICVGGPGLARGYLGRDDLTAERFVPDPLLDGQRLYRTGDLGRWRPDGTLEYLGRADDQLKIHGVRVEPGEIESALLAFPGIDAAAVAPVRIGRTPAKSDACTRCGLPASYPGATLDESGVCNLCLRFDGYRDRVRAYFRSMSDLETELKAAAGRSRGDYDCLMLLSGGKDSTYALSRLIDMGARVMAFTLDNGFLSDGAKANIRRVTSQLGVVHVFGVTSAMNAIFVDSLERHSNVCNGCFKTVYTLGARFARDHGIPLVITGLSRGQFFETRLTEELFMDDTTDPARIDRIILEARKAYHRTDDAVARLLDTSDFHGDEIFEEVRFLDFYRYCDVQLDEMLAYLAERVPWIRPADTGRSTNCLINQAGIFVHIQQRGYHNYAFPYSWDVRMGHKRRDAALAELDDEIDPGEVRRILSEIGYPAPLPDTPVEDLHLVAFYVSSEPLPDVLLREHVTHMLPDSMVPRRFVRLDRLPLTASGKVDRRALPDATPARPALVTAFVAPRSPVESRIAEIWREVLRVEKIGVDDVFLDLGGNSLLAIQIISRVNQSFDVDLPLRSAFEAATIASLARLVEDTLLAEIAAMTDAQAERLTVAEP